MIWPNCKLALAGLIIPACFGFQMYHFIMINPAQEMFKVFLNESYERTYGGEMTKGKYTIIWTFQITLLILGGICGAAAGPYLSDRYGRKWALQLSVIPVVIGTVLMCVAISVYSIELLAVGRFVIGLNYGLFPGMIGLFLNEISPTTIRGFMGSSQELSLGIACLSGMTLGIPDILGTREYIYWLLCLPLIPAGIGFVYMLFLPDTPKHLLLTKLDESGADRALLYYHGSNVDLDEVKKTFWREKALSSGPVVSWRECVRNGAIRRGILLGIVTAFATRLSGISAVFFFSTQIFHETGLSLKHANYATVLMAAANTVTSAVFPPLLIERFGRRPLLIFSFAGCLSCHITFVLFAELYDNYAFNWTAFVSVTALVAHVVFFAVGAGPISWFLVGELVPQSARSKAQTSTVVCRRIIGFLDSLAFYPLYMEIGPYALIVLSVVPTSICLVILYIYLPETRNKDIDTLFEEYQQILLKEPSEESIFA